ncbi:hypothetical protein ABFS83_08G221600 [Erythranthe nasuta]
MAPENNWLSFSLSSMEMLNSSPSSSSQTQEQAAAHHYYSFADNFYASAGWPNQKAEEAMYAEAENHHHQAKEHNDDASIMFNTYMHAPPKLEDFFADSTETQDSSLTHIYDHHQGVASGGGGGAAYFGNGEQQDLKTVVGFQAFSANSGSEVDDSAFAAQTRSPVESAAELVPYSHCYPITDNNNNNNNTANNNNSNSLSVEVNGNNNKTTAIVAADRQSGKKISDTFGQRTSIYRGVTRHRWTGRYEAHLWDNSCRREGQARKGRQVYLGGYDKEERAAHAYDLAALKYWGSTATTNFPMSSYSKEVDEMQNMTKQEFIASIRRKSSGFSRGASIYRGVTRHHQQGRWQARIGRVAGNKDLYLGTFATEEEAAEAYDIAAIKFRGINAVTNFEMNRYDVEAIANSALPIGGNSAKRLKVEEKLPLAITATTTTTTPAPFQSQYTSNNINFAAGPMIPYGVPYDNSAPFYHHNLFHQYCSNPAAAATTGAPASLMTSSSSSSQSPGEFFIWPHQSY